MTEWKFGDVLKLSEEWVETHSPSYSAGTIGKVMVLSDNGSGYLPWVQRLDNLMPIEIYLPEAFELADE